MGVIYWPNNQPNVLWHQIIVGEVVGRHQRLGCDAMLRRSTTR
jgi:hypothetical protein